MFQLSGSAALLMLSALGLGACARPAQDAGSKAPTQVKSGGTEHVFFETGDTTSNRICEKPDAKFVLNVQSFQGKVRIEVAIENGSPGAIPTRLTYAQYESSASSRFSNLEIPETGTIDFDSAVATVQSLTCVEVHTSEGRAIYDCSFPDTAGEVQVSSPSGMRWVAHELTLSNPDCDRQVTYQDRLVWFKRPDRLVTGLAGIDFPQFYRSDRK